MGELRYTDGMQTGHPEIDKQHAGLVDILNKIKQAIICEDRQQSCVLFEKFISRAKAHFSYEEAILEEIRFPYLKHHREHHAALVQRAVEAREQCFDRPVGDMMECFNNIVNVLIDDLIAADSGFKTFLIEAGYSVHRY